jgi:hypothetical protein
VAPSSTGAAGAISVSVWVPGTQTDILALFRTWFFHFRRNSRGAHALSSRRSVPVDVSHGSPVSGLRYATGSSTSTGISRSVFRW